MSGVLFCVVSSDLEIFEVEPSGNEMGWPPARRTPRRFWQTAHGRRIIGTGPDTVREGMDDGMGWIYV